MNFSFIVVKSKKSGNYFKFEQYCEDGYGKFEDTVSEFGFTTGEEMPDTFPVKDADYVMRRVQSTEFAEHTVKDVEIVTVNCNF